jgi:hypothetical protein
MSARRPLPAARVTKLRAAGPETIVFVGPTLPASAFAGCTVRGPVAMGDVLRLAMSRRPPARIAIVDGYFERMAAVWHKEILVAIDRGIEVWGAASMGALRAAELAPFGMKGVGTIWKAFAKGVLVADDEVAVTHLPAEYGYRATSDALVNLRDGIARAPNLNAKTRAALVELARKRHYRVRSWAALYDDARAAGLPAKAIDGLVAWVLRWKPDRKAADAMLLAQALAKAARKATRAPTTKATPSFAKELTTALSKSPGKALTKPAANAVAKASAKARANQSSVARGAVPALANAPTRKGRVSTPRTWALRRLEEIVGDPRPRRR